MRIVSVNAWGGAMYDDLAAWVPTVAADVWLVQEALRTPGLTGWTTFGDGERSLPQRADLVADLGGLLPEHEPTFVVSDSGPVLAPDGSEWRQDFGVLTLVDRAWPVLGHRTAFVHGAYADHPAWPSGDRPRAAHAVRLHDRAAGRGVVVVQVHGVRDPAGKGDTPARVAQADRLVALVQGVREADDLVVVAGDLNVLPGGVTHERLAAIGLVDLVGDSDTRTSRYAKPVRHADYLFVSDPAAVRHFEVVAAPEVSDHRALLLDL